MGNSKELVEGGPQFFKIHNELRKIFKSPVMYPDFPHIPHYICDNHGVLRQDFSIYKKGAAYYVVDDGKGEYIETMENISSLPIVFFFSQFELNSEHYGLTIRNKVDDLTQVDNETKLYEQAIKTVLDKRMIDIFPEHIKEKLLDLDGDLGDPNYKILEGISLYRRNGRFVVMDAEVDFSQQELEQIKRAVFV